MQDKGQVSKTSVGDDFMVFITASTLTGLKIENASCLGSLCVSLVRETVAGNVEQLVVIFLLK